MLGKKKQESTEIVKQVIDSISIYDEEKNIVYDIKLNSEEFIQYFKTIFESNEINK